MVAARAFWPAVTSSVLQPSSVGGGATMTSVIEYVETQDTASH